MPPNGINSAFCRKVRFCSLFTKGPSMPMAKLTEEFFSSVIS